MMGPIKQSQQYDTSNLIQPHEHDLGTNIHVYLCPKHLQTTQNDTTPNKTTSRPIRMLTAHPLGSSVDEVGGGYGQLVMVMSPCVKLMANSPVTLHPV